MHRGGVVYKVVGSEYFLATSNGILRRQGNSAKLGNILEMFGAFPKKIDAIPGLEVEVNEKTGVVTMCTQVLGVFAFKRGNRRILATTFFEEVLDTNDVFGDVCDNEIVGKTIEMQVSGESVIVTAVLESEGDGSYEVSGFVYDSSSQEHRIYVPGFPKDFITQDARFNEFTHSWIEFWILDGKIDESRLDEAKRVEDTSGYPTIRTLDGTVEIRLPCFPRSDGPTRIRTKFGERIEDRYHVLDSLPINCPQLFFRMSAEEEGRLTLVISPVQEMLDAERAMRLRCGRTSCSGEESPKHVDSRCGSSKPQMSDVLPRRIDMLEGETIVTTEKTTIWEDQLIRAKEEIKRKDQQLRAKDDQLVLREQQILEIGAVMKGLKVKIDERDADLHIKEQAILQLDAALSKKNKEMRCSGREDSDQQIYWMKRKHQEEIQKKNETIAELVEELRQCRRAPSSSSSQAPRESNLRELMQYKRDIREVALRAFETKDFRSVAPEYQALFRAIFATDE